MPGVDHHEWLSCLVLGVTPILFPTGMVRGATPANGQEAITGTFWNDPEIRRAWEHSNQGAVTAALDRLLMVRWLTLLARPA
jgi:hypothetical protein